MFRLRLAATAAAIRRKAQSVKQHKKSRTRRKKTDGKDSKVITGCVGLRLNLKQRVVHEPRPTRQGCSTRCRHAAHLKGHNIQLSDPSKADDWIPEDVYKHFTETDSRPLTPENYSRRSATLLRSTSVVLEKTRKCVTPEPDAKQCQFHNRRVLILDLRRVKSVDAITRQNSLTTGESIDSIYGDYDYDNRSSSANRDSSSIYHPSTPRVFSLSRSTSPKITPKAKGRTKKPKERSGSPIAYERSSSPKILEGLTLPPLHQSVLTLLGQKSGVKASPRNFVTADVEAAFDASSAAKAKKLRRHGRKKKTKEDGKESEEKEIEKCDVPALQEGRGDEFQETQLNTLHPGADNALDVRTETEKFLTKPARIKQINKSLRDVVDEYLAKEQWNPKGLENINEEIESLNDKLKKYETDFKTKSISMKEDMWLAFPRTWTKTNATFGVPSNSKLLKGLSSVEYLKDYVSITEPRLHLYNLIYQRYRILENPTGKSITIKSIQRALTEVLGRPFQDEEKFELVKHYLNVDERFELDSKTFAGICAFCERIYGKYALEDCEECIVCSKNKAHHKDRCHLRRKGEIEEMDLSYLVNKIKSGETTKDVACIIGALTKTGLVDPAINDD